MFESSFTGWIFGEIDWIVPIFQKTSPIGILHSALHTDSIDCTAVIYAKLQLAGDLKVYFFLFNLYF